MLRDADRDAGGLWTGCLPKQSSLFADAIGTECSMVINMRRGCVHRGTHEFRNGLFGVHSIDKALRIANSPPASLYAVTPNIQVLRWSDLSLHWWSIAISALRALY